MTTPRVVRPPPFLLPFDFFSLLLAEPYPGRLGDSIGRSLLPGHRALQGSMESGSLGGCKRRVSGCPELLPAGQVGWGARWGPGRRDAAG